MNPSIRSFTPRVLSNLNYDALLNNQGCQALTANRIESFFSPVQICIYTERDESPFLKPETNSFAPGPDVLNVAGTLKTMWQAFVGKNGVRLTKSTDIQIDTSTSGALSGLYNGVYPSKLSLAFDALGFPFIAIQKTASSIELKWLTAPDTTSTATFSGVSPSLFFSGLLYSSNGIYSPVVGCYYISDTDAQTLMLRLSNDNFATAHTVDASIPVVLSALLEARAESGKIVIYANDDEGRDIIISTGKSVAETRSFATYGATLDHAALFVVATALQTAQDKGTLSLSLKSAWVIKSLDTIPSTTEKSTLSVALESLELL